jgi:hypothetical protein
VLCVRSASNWVLRTHQSRSPPYLARSSPSPEIYH